MDQRSGGIAAILGGGPSLPIDMAKLPEDCTLIAVNNHAWRLCIPDVMVFMDTPSDVPALVEAIGVARSLNVPVVSPREEESDIKLPKGEFWDGGFSSTLATWFALWQEFDAVILCGMDCYQGEQKYFYERSGFYHPVFDYPVENHLRAWRLAFDHCPHPERIRAMSGPLIEVFGKYE